MVQEVSESVNVDYIVKRAEILPDSLQNRATDENVVKDGQKDQDPVEDTENGNDACPIVNRSYMVINHVCLFTT